MKRILSFLCVLGTCCTLSGCGQTGAVVGAVLLAVMGIGMLLIAGFRISATIKHNRRRPHSRHFKKYPVVDAITAALLILGLGLLILMFLCVPKGDTPTVPVETKPTPAETEPAVTDSPFVPEKTAVSDPANWGIRWEIFEGSSITHSYEREQPISFGDPESYFALPGIAAFRGNNYRNNATYGTATVTEKKISTAWSADIGSLGPWTGCGWTGQPLVVKWDDATLKNMNIYDSKKNKDGLVEAIYATLDGHIYFYDIDDGTYTRDPINIGMCFKGSGSLDPRGYPLLYVGSGDESPDGRRPRMFIISLISGSVLYEYGDNDPLSYRLDNDNWCAYDSSPLVDAETDTLIWPGESGILYTFKLNSHYDAASGTVSVQPDDPVLTRYLTDRSGKEKYWLGYESSASIVDHYLYISENGGMFYCIDLNTMELNWAQDTKDDSNSSPLFERVSQDQGYVYTAPSLHWTRDGNMQGSISIYKLDAVTGEIVWEKPYSVHTVDGVSGGVQSTPLLGKKGTDIEGLIIYTIARLPQPDAGRMVALDTKTGEGVWSMDIDDYVWSSPVAYYTEDGKAYIVVCDNAGKITLVDGKTGTVLSSLSLNGPVQSSPVVYEDMLIVGTRHCKVYGIRIR